MSVQNSYTLDHIAGFVGQYADLQLSNVFSRSVEVTEIDFGLAVVRGTADDQCKLPSVAPGKFLGVTGRTIAGTADTAGDRKYQIGESANILDEGTIYAICEDGCTQGDPVEYRYVAGTGQLGGFVTANVVGETVLIPNVEWDKTVTAGEISLLKFK